MPNTNIYDDAPQSVRDFLSYKRITQGRSEKTCFQYYHDLRSFFRYLLTVRYPTKFDGYSPDDLPFSEVDDEMVYTVSPREILNFLTYCADTRRNMEAARNRKLSALSSFYKYLTSTANSSDSKYRKNMKEPPTKNLETIRRPKRLPKYLSLDESKQLLENVEGANYERDFAIITLFLNCGMRVSELAGISLRDIDREFRTVRVIGKGNKERVIYLNDACRDALKSYLAIRPKDVRPEAKEALFISRNRNRISDKTVQWLVYKHLKNAGLDRPGMSVHKLRHTAATIMYQYGHTDVRVLKEVLGHEHLNTTEIYTHVSDRQLADAANSNPLSSVKPQKKQKHLSDIDSGDDKDDE